MLQLFNFRNLSVNLYSPTHSDTQIRGALSARDTRDHISNLRWIMERQLEYGQEVHICFIDYRKAFDCINHELLWKTLLEMGIPKHLIQLLKGLYGDQS